MKNTFTIPADTLPELHSHFPERVLNARSRSTRAEHIATLSPERDCQEIAFLLGCYEFPWDTTRSLELALFRVFGVAKGTPLLVQTGEFLSRVQKRYDDTVLILSEILENGYDSPRGRAALRRMNEQHGRYQIPNDEYLYTLSTFIFEPIRWNERFGWRKLTQLEKQSSYYLWREIGRRMGIKDIPESYEAFERFNIEFERTHFRFSENNRLLAESTRNLMLSWVLPKWLWPVGAPFIHALLDEPMLRAVGFPSPPGWLRGLVEGLLRVRASLLSLLPPRRRARLLTRVKNRTYPTGYAVDQLGADR